MSKPIKDDFLLGVCVALQCTKDCGVTWAEIVRTVGVDDLLYYAAHVEPEEWELAGFNQHAMAELQKLKPRKKKQATAATRKAMP